MKNRSIVVPKDNEAEQLLDYDRASAAQLIRLAINENESNLLWREEIFDVINEVGDSNIDDYEDDSVVGEDNVRKVIEALKLREASSNDELNELVSKIRHLFEEALQRGTGVYFYF